MVFVANLLLCTLLLLWPYFYNRPHGEELYSVTHSFGLDPREWWPFAGEGIGLFLYNMVYLVWFFAAFLTIPFIIAQVIILWRNWWALHTAEKFVHCAFAGISAFLSLFMLTIGQAILYYMLD